MEDHQIVALFEHRAEIAVEETAKKYGALCHQIAYRILDNREDAAEIVNDTYLRLWNTIPPQTPKSLKAYAASVCKHLALDRYESDRAQKRGGGQLPLVLDELADCIPDGTPDPTEQSALRDAIHAFLDGLSPTVRILFIRRYWYLTPLGELAAQTGMREGALAMLMLRARKKLKKHLQKEGFEV
jgi:RNA polymerase sigma-70 factor (ECF subfamily)